MTPSSALTSRVGLVWLGLSTACMPPPSTLGLRSTGDIAPASTVTLGGGLAGVSHGLSGGALDSDFSLSDKVAVGGSVGWFAQSLQGQAQVRWSPQGAERKGVGLVGGVSALHSWAVVGPYFAASGRVPVGESATFYGAAKFNRVVPLAEDLVFRPANWVTPTLGVSRATGPNRIGFEVLAPISPAGLQWGAAPANSPETILGIEPIWTTIVTGGVQLWVGREL